MMKSEHGRWRIAAALAAMLVVAACGGGGSKAGGEQSAVDGGGAVPTPNPTDNTATNNCIGQCADTPTRLTAADVQQVIAQAVAEAEARNVTGTIAVTDRVGNVLAVFRMTGADQFVTVTSSADGSAPITGGLEGVNIIPDTLAAIAKAVTGAYLTSEGNAFSTRTASQIVQENFNPGEGNQPSGPLFGVQFSQLPCGDFVERFETGDLPGPGPHRSPLGLAADVGGLPLYKRGTPVGGIGVIADGIYGLDRSLLGFDSDDERIDEIIATAGTVGFAAPVDRRGDAITLIGKTARFNDSFVDDLISVPANAPAFATLDGALVAVNGYYDGAAVLAGTAFGQPESGIRPAGASDFLTIDGVAPDAFVFVDENNVNRYPPRNGLDLPGGDAANRLTAAEVRQLLSNGLAVANTARAQIRQPDGSKVAVTLSVVDSDGNILGMARTRDAPVFGADVSLQKARTAAFFSGTGRVGGISPADALRGLPDPLYLGTSPLPPNPATLVTLVTPPLADYVTDLQTFLGIPLALEANGPAAAFADRSGGNLSRPNYPDGPADGPPGPLSKPPGQWSIFSVGLQLDLVYNAVIHHVAFVLGVVPDVGDTSGDGMFSDADLAVDASRPDIDPAVVAADGTLSVDERRELFTCTGSTSLPGGFAHQASANGLANGIQIFPGSVPVYRGNVLVGAMGISGDGVDQDDMVAFLGTDRAGAALGTINNAPPAIRADTIDIPGESERLRYVSCPQAPFLNSDEDDVCDGR